MKKLIVTLAVLLTVSCSYTNFRTHKVKYQKSEHVTNDSGAATATLILLGYEIEKATWEVIETKVERLYKGQYPYTVEFQTWIKVWTQAGVVKAYCTQRKLYDTLKKNKQADWKFDKCTDKNALERVNLAVEELVKRLEDGL